MIKGRYVCQVEVDFAYEEDKEDKPRNKFVFPGEKELEYEKQHRSAGGGKRHGGS